MIYQSILAFHLIGAIISGLIVLYALYAMHAEQIAVYRRIALVLWALAAFESVSGVMLLMLKPELSVMMVCSRLVIYLFIIGSVEAMLSYRMKTHAQQLPAGKTAPGSV